MFSKNYTQTHVQTAARECAVLGYNQLSFASPLFHFCDDRGGCFILVRLFEYLFLSDVCFMFVLSGLMFLVFPMMKHIHGFSLFVSQVTLATPSIAFRHLPPNSARFSYATEAALFISAQLSRHRRGQRPPKGSGTDKAVEAT